MGPGRGSTAEANGRPNSRDVARHAGVSVGTVSNVLNKPDMVSQATRDKVEEAIRELGFVRNRSARQLRMGRSQTVGLLVVDIAGPYFTAVAKGVEQRLKEAEFSLMLCSSDRSPEEERRHLAQLEEQGASGILVVPSGDDYRMVNELRSRGTAVVLLDHPSPDSHHCAVAVDDVKGGALAAQHLLDLGHRRIGLVNAPAQVQQGTDRREGAHRATRAAGLDVDETILEVTVPAVTANAGEEAVERLLADHRPPTAVMCINDLVALGVLRGLQARGLKVPDDVAVVGYDDVEFAAMLASGLTSVRRPKGELGTRAVDLLLEEIEHGGDHLHQQILFTPELVVRASSDPTASTPG